MAHTDKIPEEVLQSVIAQAKEVLKPGAEKLLSGKQLPQFSLGETLAAWTLDEDAINAAQTSQNIADLARPTGCWHQFHVDNEAKIFARSDTLDQESQMTLLQIQASPLAERVDKAISIVDDPEWADKNLGYDPLTRLLIAPALRLYALWLIDEKTKSSKALVICNADGGDASEEFHLYSSQEFLKMLLSKERIFGLGDSTVSTSQRKEIQSMPEVQPATSLDEKARKIEERLSKLEATIGDNTLSLEGRIGNLSGAIGHLSGALEDVNRLADRIDRRADRLDRVVDRMDRIEDRVDRLASAIEDLAARIGEKGPSA